jgi:CIC family chloride channel protein
MKLEFNRIKRKLVIKIIKWRYKHISHQHFIYILSAIVGLLAGLGAVILKNITHLIQYLLEGKFIKEIHHAFYFVFPILGLLIVTLIIKYIIKKRVGHGIPSTLFAISKLKGIMSKHQIWSSILTAPITVGFGGSVGLEGPTVATGAAMGSNFARLFHLNQKKRNLLIGAATAGAMSSIFKAPIAAIIFAVEIFSLDLTIVSIVPLLLASITAVLTSYFFLGDDVLLHFKLEDRFKLQDVIFYILLGITSAITSIYFSKVYFSIDAFFKKFINPYKRFIIGGVLIGLIVFFIPPLYGEGYETINNLLKGNVSEVIKDNIFHFSVDNINYVVIFLIGLVTFKVVAMSFTFGAGGIGGVFAPTLFTGSISGYIFALIINHSALFNFELSPINFAMVGMAGLMAGVLHAPLTAIFLIAEITGGYELFVPLMIVSSISYLVTNKYIPFNIYASELAKKGELLTHDKDKNTILLMEKDHIIEQDFITVTPNMSLGKLLKKAVAKSKRNLFPVIDEEQNLIGIILLDDIREIMFNKKMYKKVFVRDLMHNAPDVIFYNKDSMQTIMNKFTTSNAWNLPVLRNGKYYGFISKSKMLTAYRDKLIEVSS